MFHPRFTIYAETAAGETIECFRWTRDAESGIRRARRDAPAFGFELRRFWAEPIAAEAKRCAQLVQVRAASPLRPPAGRTDPIDGLGLFDAARQPDLI